MDRGPAKIAAPAALKVGLLSTTLSEVHQVAIGVDLLKSKGGIIGLLIESCR